MKDDGSLRSDSSDTRLTKLFLHRRSVRKYARGAATSEQVALILACVKAFQERVGFELSSVSVVHGEAFDAVVRGATTGLVGKVNPWLPYTNARHLILCGARYGADDDNRTVERAIEQAAMSMQVAILAATELGLATCWMAGINHDRVEQAHAMPDGARLIAISALGLPPAKMGMSWDTVAYHLVSKRRKPLDALWMPDSWKEER